MEKEPVGGTKHLLRIRVQEYAIPALRDVLVLGKASPIGCVAFRRALEFLSRANYVDIEIQDDVISHLIVRSTILRLVPQVSLIDLVLRRIKPLIGPEDIMHLNIETEVLLEEEI
jgi:hypothetical protein